ncbi:MAG: PAS domain-containing protein, partial [Desulfobacteraceae bacterium]
MENIEKLKNRIITLETQVKHLTNDLHVTREENDISMSKYFELYTHMESKVAERTQQLLKAHEILERKGKELEVMLDSSPAIIFYKDNDFRYQRINKKFNQIMGLPVQEIIGKKYSELFPENEDYSLHNDLKVLESGTPLLTKKEIFKASNGQRKLLIDRIPYKDDDNKTVGFIGFALDITELESAEKQKKKLEKQLQRGQKMETLGTLAGGVAHDLNNVLSGIVSYPDLLLMNIPDDSPLKKPILAIKKSGEKAAAIVQDLLTLARRGVVSMEVLNLNNVILEYLESLEHAKLRSFHAGVDIEVNLGSDLLNITGSPVHLSKVVMNLISNAAEAMPDGGIASITTENRYVDTPIAGYDRVEEGDYVVLTIKDTGTGISPEDIDQIFEPFYTKKIMGRSGTGLGMSVIWGTVK